MHKQWGAVDYLKSLTDITRRRAGQMRSGRADPLTFQASFLC